MELETAWVRWAKRSEAGEPVRAFTGDKIWTHTMRDLVERGRAIVAKKEGGWRNPPVLQTFRGPRLVTEVWAAPSQDEDGKIIADDAVANCWAVVSVMTRVMHGMQDVWWGSDPERQGVYVAACDLDVEPYALPPGIQRELGYQQQIAPGIGGAVRCVVVQWAVLVG